MAKTPNTSSTAKPANPYEEYDNMIASLRNGGILDLPEAKPIAPGQDLTFASLVYDGGKESDQDLVFSSITKGETGEDFALTKGIDHVKFPRSERAGGEIITGKLIDWSDPEKFVVLAFDKNDRLLKKTFRAEQLFALNPELEEEIKRQAVSKESRKKLTSVLEDYQSRRITGRTIDNGKNAETLEASIRPFTLPGGIEGAAATSLAGYKYEMREDSNGLKKPININEDRFYVNTNTGFVAVVDGMGGGTLGSLSANIVAEALAVNENDVLSAARSAQKQLQTIPEIGKADGACFLSAKIEVDKPIDIGQCGDVDIYHFDENGDTKYEPGQQLEMGESAQSAFEFLDQLASKRLPKAAISNFVRNLAGMGKKEMTEVAKAGMDEIVDRIAANQKPLIPRSNPVYGSLRKVVVNAVTKTNAEVARFKTKSPVEKGDWVLIMSDGVSDNFMEEEIRKFMKTAIAENWTPEYATKVISKALDERIKLKANKDPRAKQHHFKLDNATIILMRVKGQGQISKTNEKAA